VQEWSPGLILMDTHAAWMVRHSRWIKANPRGEETVVVRPRSAMTDDRTFFTEAERYDFLAKPLREEDCGENAAPLGVDYDYEI